MAALTTTVVDAFLASRLGGDATLHGLLPSGVWRDSPPQGTVHPFGVWQFVAGNELWGSGPHLIWTDLDYTVKVVGKGSAMATVRQAAERIDALLQLSRGIATGGYVVAVARQQQTTYVEDINGVRYEHLGARYKLYVQGA